MRKLILLVLTICFYLSANAQTEASKFKQTRLKQLSGLKDVMQQFANYDLSKLWTITNDKFVYGFIGDDYQRIRIKFITVKKTDKFTYEISGKTKVKDNICDFKGTLNISTLGKYETTTYGLDDEYKNKIKGRYTILGDYTLAENSAQKNTGIFKGVFETGFYLDKNSKIHYDNIDLNADGFTNNEFIGSWTQYAPSKTKRCNWGDYRIPNSGDLDVGAGDFSPNKKYVQNGWLDVYEQYQPASLKKPAVDWWQ